MSEYRDLIQQAVTNTPGTSGNFTLGSAASGMRALQSTDNGKQFDLMVSQSGLGSEVRRGCIYTHSGTTITRGILVTSTTGSALSFTSAAVVRVSMPARTMQAITASLSASASVQKNMLTQGGIALQPVPARTVPHKSTGTVYYIDPTVGGAGSGTYADPWQSASSIPTLTAGQSVLFKTGTTTTITASIGLTNSGTSSNPIVFGVYMAFTDLTGANLVDRRVYGTPGAATINCNGNAISGFSWGDSEYVCIDGLRIINNSGAFSLIQQIGNVRNNQILNCVMSNTGTGAAGQLYIYTNSTVGGNVIEGCQVTCNPAATDASAIVYRFNAAESVPTKIQFNRVGGADSRNMFIWDDYAFVAWNGIIACNVVDNSRGRTDADGGINVVCGGGAPKIFRNISRRNKTGIAVVSSRGDPLTTAGSDFSGLLIENNDCSNNQMNIGLNGVWGPAIIQYNRLTDAGSKDGTAGVTSENYGRNIEIYGVNDSQACRGVIIRFNYCSGAYNWHNVISTPGSEGSGIGLDDRTRDTLVYGNYCTNNEGSGIQLNQTRNVHVFGNICVDNSNPRAGRDTSAFRQMDMAELAFILAKDCLIFNNTFVSTKRANQRYSISEAYEGYTSTGTKIFNNLCIGAAVAGIRMDVTGASAVEYNNLIIDAPVLVKNISDVDTTAGAGTVAGTAADYSAETPYYLPTPGGLADKTGTAPPGFAMSFDGFPLETVPQVGAMPVPRG